MIRKLFKKQKPNKKIADIMAKYKVPKAYLSVNRKTIANAMLIGMFFAMMPMPMQMLAVLLCVPFIKFNVPLSLTMVWISNPFTMPFIFYGEYLLGNLILFREGLTDITLSLEWFQENLDAIFLPLFVGALVSGLVLAFTSRYLVLHLWRRSVHKEKREKLARNNSQRE